MDNKRLIKLPFSIEELDADTMTPKRRHYRNRTQIVSKARRAKLDKLYKGGKMFRSDI